MEERRAEMKQLIEKIDSIEKEKKTVVDNLKIIKGYIEHQFGGVDLSGNKVEGLMTRQINVIENKLESHDKAIDYLKGKDFIITGAVALLIFGIPILTTIWLNKGH